MDCYLVPLAAAALLLPIAYLAVPPALSAWRRRLEVRRGFKPRPAEKLVIPAADETAATIERFHEALRRSDLADFLRPN
jgi:hypothetical protein